MKHRCPFPAGWLIRRVYPCNNRTLLQGLFWNIISFKGLTLERVGLATDSDDLIDEHWGKGLPHHNQRGRPTDIWSQTTQIARVRAEALNVLIIGGLTKTM